MLEGMLALQRETCRLDRMHHLMPASDIRRQSKTGARSRAGAGTSRPAAALPAYRSPGCRPGQCVRFLSACAGRDGLGGG